MTKIRATVVTSVLAWEELAPTWKKLYACTDWAGSPMQIAWTKTWWEIFGEKYGASPGGLRIVVIYKDEVPIGIVPFYLQQRGFFKGGTCLRMISTGEAKGETTYPEYLHPLIDKSYEKVIFEALRNELINNPLLKANEFSPGLIDYNSPFASFIADNSLDAFLGKASSRTIPGIQCDITGGLETYLQKLGQRSRKAFRKNVRESSEKNLDFSVATASNQVSQWLEELFEIHQSRWARDDIQGAFSSEKIKQFHRLLAPKLLNESSLVLTRLSLDSKPLALLYGFIKDTRVEMYQSAVVNDNESPVRSAGIILHLLTMQHAVERGCTLYDLLGWESEYKRRFETQRSLLLDLHRCRPSLPTSVLRFKAQALSIGKKGVRTIQKRLNRRPSPCSDQGVEVEQKV